MFSSKAAVGKGAHTAWVSFRTRRLCGPGCEDALCPRRLPWSMPPDPPTPGAGNTPSELGSGGATPREHPTAILLRLRRRPLDLHELVERKVVGRDAGVVDLLEAHDDRVAITGFRDRRHRPTAIRHEFHMHRQ